MLLMVCAETTVIGTSPLYGGVVDEWHFGRLDENLAAAAVVVDVVGDQDALVSVLGAAFEQEHLIVLKDCLPFDFSIAGRADGEGDVVEEIGTGLGHRTFRAR